MLRCKIDRRVRFVSCSATISNPQAHMKNIFGIQSTEIETVTKDGAPSGRKDFLVWNPQYIDPMVPTLGRHSSISEATILMGFLMKRGIRVILFCKVCMSQHLASKHHLMAIRATKIRKVCELVRFHLASHSSIERRG